MAAAEKRRFRFVACMWGADIPVRGFRAALGDPGDHILKLDFIFI